MILAICGATGRTGRILVEQALAANHTVRAISRSPWRLGIGHERVTPIQWKVDEPGPAAAALAGVEAVLSVMGPSRNEPGHGVSRVMEQVIAGMQQHAIRRLVVSSGAAVRDPSDNPKRADHTIRLLLRLSARHVLADMTRLVAVVRASDRAWTVVRVPRLTDEPHQTRLIVGYVGRDIGLSLSRTDLALFMLKQLSDETYLRKAPMISN